MKDISLLTTMYCELQPRFKLTWTKSNNKIKATACNWNIVLHCEIKFKYGIEVNLCFGTQCTLCSSRPTCKILHPSFFNINHLFSSTSTYPTLGPLPLVIVSMLFYMYWLNKKGHYMWWYFTCKHVSLFLNPVYNMYVVLQKKEHYLQWVCKALFFFIHRCFYGFC